jgi:hypothetical protein
MSLPSKIIYIFFYKTQYFILRFLGFDMTWFKDFYGIEVSDSLSELYSSSFSSESTFRNRVRFFFYLFFIGFSFFYFFYLFKGLFYDAPNFDNRWVDQKFDFYLSIDKSSKFLLDLKNSKPHIYDDVIDARDQYKRWLLQHENFEKKIFKFTKIFFILIIFFYHPLFEFIQIK